MESSNKDFGEDCVDPNLSNDENNATNESRRRTLNYHSNCFETPKRQRMSNTAVANNQDVKRKLLLRNYSSIRNTNINNIDNRNQEQIEVSSDYMESESSSMDPTISGWSTPVGVPLPAQAERTRLRNPPPLIHTPDTSALDLSRHSIKLLTRPPNNFCDTLPPPTYEDGAASTSNNNASNNKRSDNWMLEKQPISFDDPFYTERSPIPDSTTGSQIPRARNIWTNTELSTRGWNTHESDPKWSSSNFWDDMESSPNKHISSNLFEEQYTLDSRMSDFTNRYVLPKQAYIDRWADAIDLTIPISDELTDYTKYRYSCDISASPSPPLLEDEPVPGLYLGPSTSDGRTISEYQFFRPYNNKDNDSDDSA